MVTVEKINNVKSKIKIALLATIVVLLVLLFLMCFLNPSDEKIIEDRIETFLTAYNQGDLDTVLDCFDTKSRNTLKPMLNLFGGFVGSLAGFSINISDLFSLGVNIRNEDCMYIKITDVEISNDKTALVTAVFSLEGDEARTIYFDMLYEKDGWYIKNMYD